MAHMYLTPVLTNQLFCFVQQEHLVEVKFTELETIRRIINKVLALCTALLIPGFFSCYSVSLVSPFLSPDGQR